MAVRVLKELWAFRQTLIVVLTPLVLLPLPLALPVKEARGAYGLLIMAIYWVTEAIPIPVTALLPMVLFPMLGVIDAGVLSKEYLKDTNMLFLGGLMVAVAVERWNLHKRIALRVLLMVGSETKWLMLGFMIPTAFLSMWISNTATTAMMVPIAQAVITQLIESRRAKLKRKLTGGSDKENGEMVSSSDSETQLGEKVAVYVEMTEIDPDSKPPLPEENHTSDNVTLLELDEKQEVELQNIRKGMTLCVAYAATCGGVSTLTGTGPNLILKGQTDTIFNNKAGINFTSWFIFAFPCSVIALITCYIWLQLYFLGFKNSIFSCKRKTKDDILEEKATKDVIRNELNMLGPMSFAEILVSLHFGALALLWLTRESDFFEGWGTYIPGGFVSDSTPAILLAISLFMFPSTRPNFFFFRAKDDISDPGPRPGLLDWHTVTHKFSWGIVILLGGGFALAKACEVSGLSALLGRELTAFAGIPPWAIAIIITILVAAVTEVTSNVAIATIFLPILAQLSIGIGVHPLYLMLPGCVASSFAFMLPVATPPNAIVFSYGAIKVVDMAKAGVMLNLLCIGIVNIAINTWGMAYFNLGEFPEWANTTLQEQTTAAVVDCAWANGTLSR